MSRPPLYGPLTGPAEDFHMNRWIVLFGSLFFLASAVNAADDPKKTNVPAGHSSHGEIFNEGPRQKAYLMDGTGKVHLPVTTPVPLAQQFFDQGVGQLHGFWFFEAERSFR